MDWVPMAFYGTSIAVPAGTTTFVILYPLPDYVGDQEFLFEDEDETGLFLERIVGDLEVTHTEAAGGQISWQLMPLGVDYETPDVLQPFTSVWTPFNSEWANLRWWDRRHYTADPAAVLPAPAPTAHPWWTHVDINPRQMMGAKRNLWPVLVLRNHEVQGTARFTPMLRALWK